MSLKQAIQTVDHSGMLAKVLDMPSHFEAAWRSNQEVTLPFDRGSIRNITIAGMGGSAISGDVVRCLLQSQCPVPILVNRHYELGRYVNEHSLVFVSSYSGNTEETLSAMAEAREHGAKVVCITSNGRVMEQAKEAGYPLYTLPSGFPPRSALVYLTVPLLQALQRLELAEDPWPAIQETIQVLNRLRELYQPDNETVQNIPLTVAKAVKGKIPIVYSAAGLLEVAGVRWRGQFSENAEILAYSNVFPEMNHNEIVGWGQQAELDRQLQVIYLRDRQDHPRIKLRMDVLREVIEATTDPILEIWSEGESALARLFSVIFTGDLASVYLAALLGVDPTPVKKIDYLKETLAKHH